MGMRIVPFSELSIVQASLGGGWDGAESVCTRGNPIWLTRCHTSSWEKKIDLAFWGVHEFLVVRCERVLEARSGEFWILTRSSRGINFLSKSSDWSGRGTVDHLSLDFLFPFLLVGRETWIIVTWAGFLPSSPCLLHMACQRDPEWIEKSYFLLLFWN